MEESLINNGPWGEMPDEQIANLNRVVAEIQKSFGKNTTKDETAQENQYPTWMEMVDAAIDGVNKAHPPTKKDIENNDKKENMERLAGQIEAIKNGKFLRYPLVHLPQNNEGNTPIVGQQEDPKKDEGKTTNGIDTTAPSADPQEDTKKYRKEQIQAGIDLKKRKVNRHLRSGGGSPPGRPGYHR